MMQAPRELRHFGYAFLIAVVGYAVLYFGIESVRPAKGPWRVDFTTNSVGYPKLAINQPRLGVTNVQVVLAASLDTNLRPTSVSFEQPRQVPFALPIGECIFLDTTFLPGTVTMALGGHEIELLPRVLVIDHQAHQWKPHAVFYLTATNAAGQ
jgi:hypothetical protein